ncbi:Gmad2 immunoglobulin-like domain-containing protein [Neomicrococcus lactis]|uniref:Cytoskeletal protein RodZ n=1 Tax=Neomicrococcus lactis TaxID=732241 RepID=A0A7W8YCR9_9MICC|nr:Gmad2 immunoglobulin-like domain-containing protein [Neomicrococcus lactis]MBB5598996.1 cytoskeletal protein RodZ [Neomicrococcus lactis]
MSEREFSQQDPDDAHPGSPGVGAGANSRRNTAILALVVAVIALVVALFMMFSRGGGTPPATSSSPGVSSPDGIPSTLNSSSSPTVASSTSAATTSTSAPTSAASSSSVNSSATALPAAEAKNVVWPNPAGSLRYSSAEEAVQGFAEELVGFTDPVYGDVQQGDARSGEVEIRNDATSGAVTTVMFRQMSDGFFYILGAVSSETEPAMPAAGAAISSPVTVTGKSRAFEAVVNVHLYAHGTSARIGEAVVMGGSAEPLEPFTGSVTFAEPGAATGALVFLEYSAKDGSVYTAAAVPVSFEEN